jgi:hypothetical protein
MVAKKDEIHNIENAIFRLRNRALALDRVFLAWLLQVAALEANGTSLPEPHRPDAATRAMAQQLRRQAAR